MNQDGEVVGEIGPTHHDHVSQLLSLGVAIQFHSVRP